MERGYHVNSQPEGEGEGVCYGRMDYRKSSKQNLPQGDASRKGKRVTVNKSLNFPRMLAGGKGGRSPVLYENPTVVQFGGVRKKERVRIAGRHDRAIVSRGGRGEIGRALTTIGRKRRRNGLTLG